MQKIQKIFVHQTHLILMMKEQLPGKNKKKKISAGKSLEYKAEKLKFSSFDFNYCPFFFWINFK